MKYNIVTIGSGLGGLVSSALLAKRGKKVLLLEQHSIPGGYCTSYERKGFIFNIPSVMNDVKEGELYSMLNSLGFYDEIEWVEIENFAKYIYPDFEVVMPANDLRGCRENLKLAFPSEKSAIDNIFSKIVKLQNDMFLLQQETRSARNIISFVPTLLRLIKLSKISFYDYLKKFTKNERLITVLSSLSGYVGLPSKKTPAMSLLMLSGMCYGKSIFFPKNGYQAVSDLLAKKILEFGGEIRYNAKVSKILMGDKEAIGVKTEAREEYYGDIIISNADTKKTFFELIGRDNLPYKYSSKIDAHEPSASGISLHIGTNLDLSQFDLKYGQIFYNESWEDGNSFYDKTVANEIDFEKDKIQIGLQAPSLLSETLAPKGTYTLHILVAPISHRYMNNFGIINGKRGEEYRKIKNKLCDILIRKVEKLIPGLSKSIIVKDLSTPYTFERYTEATNGAWYDGVYSINQKFQKSSAKTPIKNLYLTGTKALGGGGMPPALMGGILTVKTILRNK